MAWSSHDYLDTFTHYPIAQMAGYGKWTSSLTLPSGVTISEDGLQGISGGSASRTLPTGPTGRIVGSRWSGIASPSQTAVFSLRTIANVGVVAMHYMGETGQLRLTFFVTGAPAAITTTLLNITNNNLNNVDFACLFTGTTCNYRTRLNSTTLVTELTGSFATTDVPAMQILSISNDSVLGTDRRCWIYTKPYSGSGGWSDVEVDAAFLGNVNRGVQNFNADGTYTIAANWNASTGGSGVALVDEVLADPSDYVLTTVDPGGVPGNNDKISFSLQDTPSTLTNVKAVQRSDLLWMATGGGTCRIGYKITAGAGEVIPAVDISPPAAATFHITPLSVDPRDGAAWTKAKLDDLELIVQARDLI